MEELLAGVGLFVLAAGIAVWVLTFARPEPARREGRRLRSLNHRARDAGLMGRWRFEVDRPGSGPTSGYGTYEPASEEDRALYDAIGSRIEGEAKFSASEILWTDAKLAWAGTGLILIGVAITIDSILM